MVVKFFMFCHVLKVTQLIISVHASIIHVYADVLCKSDIGPITLSNVIYVYLAVKYVVRVLCTVVVLAIYF